jgi:hypothetical protein
MPDEVDRRSGHDAIVSGKDHQGGSINRENCEELRSMCEARAEIPKRGSGVYSPGCLE